MTLTSDRHCRQCDVTAIADDVHELRLGEELGEHGDVQDIGGHLVAIARLALPSRVVSEDPPHCIRIVGDRAAVERRPDVRGIEAEIAAHCRVGEQVGREAVDVEPACPFVRGAAAAEGEDETSLVGHRQLGVPIEHAAEHRCS